MTEDRLPIEKQINGIKLYYEWLPNLHAEKTIVFLHGFLSSSFSFRKLVPLLQEQYSLLLIDWPPFGKTEKSKKYHYSYRNISYTIAALIKQLSATNITVAGHSMGGQLALHLIKHHPEIAENAVLISASGYIPQAKKRLIAASYLPFADQLVKKWLEKTGVEGNLRKVVFDQAMIEDEMILGYEEPFLKRDIFTGLARFLRHREGDFTSQELQTILTPCLLIYGEHDRIVPLSTGRRLADDLPISVLKVIPRAGHLVPEEKPEETARLIQDFLQTNSNK
ncbi:pimeloyl-ACP methyl ester carboxylesterase [Bacillus ectoiniformans]|uniref:alpha/beta fold hydrolase n=1 Tax=Bacillus ectoiniformans TaxID=1494429 RepID=UPI00195AD68F|nr:alpha/beta hydrolase [Bacillus ectoiniformans]MBM7648496.1 pimeloyl-ACP methyl ester carboxylesterase [Bacillus ectoiniformans]